MINTNTKNSQSQLIKERTFELSCTFLIKRINAVHKEKIDDLLTDIETGLYGELQTIISDGKIIAIEYTSDQEEDFWPSSLDEVENEINGALNNFIEDQGGYNAVKS